MNTDPKTNPSGTQPKAPPKPPIAYLVDQFSEEFKELAGPLVEQIQVNLSRKMNLTAAVDLALIKLNVTRKISESILQKLVYAAAIGFGVEPANVADPVGIRKSFLNAIWPGDKLTLSERIATAQYRIIIIDTINAQMLRARSWSQTAEALSNPLKIGGGPNFTKADIAQRLDDLAKAAHKVAPDDLASLAEFKGKLAAAKAHVNRLSLHGAPNQTLKTIYKDVIKAAETMKLGALDSAMRQAVRDKARYNAERIARTEIARAYGAAADLKMLQDPDVIAERIMLSTRHPNPDICNVHTESNLYGMGPGVYPKTQKPPYPFHANCLCVKTEIFIGEVELKDKMRESAGAEYLQGLSGPNQRALLGIDGAESFRRNPGNWKKHLRSWEGHQVVKIIEGLNTSMF